MNRTTKESLLSRTDGRTMIYIVEPSEITDKEIEAILDELYRLTCEIFLEN